MAVMVRHSTIANNANFGLLADVAATIWVTQSTITGNGTGLKGQGSGGTLTSYGDNNVVGNGTDGTPTNTATYE
jgi:hypothetical protein